MKQINFSTMTATADLLPRAGQVLSTIDLRRTKQDRDSFLSRPRLPIKVVLDGITQNYNLGALFRLCDAFLIERLVICGPTVNLRKRKPGLPGAGFEKHGVSPEVVNMANAVVAIPMLGMANSLNVATAAAILLHWLSLGRKP